MRKINWFVFFTVDTPYQEEAHRLHEELQSRDIDHFLVGYGSCGDWMKNAMKRVIDLSRAGDIPCGIMDSDLYLIGPCDRLKYAPEKIDILTHHRPALPENSQYCAGITAFCSEKSRKALTTWAILCQQDTWSGAKLREQIYLRMAIRQNDDLIVSNIGDEYNHINNELWTIEQCKANGIQILHGGLKGPASRRYLSLIGGKR